MNEYWRVIPDYPNYQASNLGNVCGPRGRLHPRANKFGYLYFALHESGNRKWTTVHKVIGQLFVENPNQYPQINHIDGDKTNNYASNLEWCTAAYNMAHAHRTGLMPRVTGERNGASKLTIEQVTEIIENPNNKTGSQLARDFKVSRSLVCMIKKGILWNERLNGGKP